jgi:hypothetical protein
MEALAALSEYAQAIAPPRILSSIEIIQFITPEDTQSEFQGLKIEL